MLNLMWRSSLPSRNWSDPILKDESRRQDCDPRNLSPSDVEVNTPQRPIPPGKTLEQKLADMGWSQGDLAAILGRPVQAVNEIITGKKAITPETAVALSRALGLSAESWLQLESGYRLSLLRLRNAGNTADVERKARLYSKVPLKELMKLGWLDIDLNDLDKAEEAVCRFLEIGSMDEEPNVPFAARKSDKYALHSQ